MFGDEFTIHLTVSEQGAAEFAERHGLAYSHVVLARGHVPSHHVLSITSKGTLKKQQALAGRWVETARAAGLADHRVKIETSADYRHAPRTDEQAWAGSHEPYFEHRVKVRLPRAESIRRLAEVARAGWCSLYRDVREADSEVRFVAQRCYRAGRTTAQARLKKLLTSLHEYEVLDVEERYVAHNSGVGVDRTWPVYHWETARGDFPSSYHPLPAGSGAEQARVFDPSMKHFDSAYLAGEPEFADAEQGARWRAARRAAMEHVLAVVAASPAAKNLVVRGSVTMRAWFGDAAREPGDVDFVVIPPGMPDYDVLDAVVAAVAGNPGPLLAEGVTREEIWTYERVPGQRLVFPFEPGGSVQLDFVFGERLPVPPEPLEVRPGVTMLAATPGLSLAWKLLWLATDMYPQGKDLYDAVLLAEHSTVSLALVIELIESERKALGERGDLFSPGEVLKWDVDWTNFVSGYPSVTGGVDEWKRRLEAALTKAWT
ncbi:Nucleotidyl transferase AbiEii toxin, Type IV TA system [Amycolatopsis xylanica]|uniref:Nucleotidyl transferase AbiEii toxin, Type IV TA system n=1 Tax=Amycolatopsis xylanica TaxID=589385 RepID=A0A1H2YMA3_9PSEU|nr:nucleotidyl transferase AbiEii/AbiGii toxin family protein [Amycolatopsis xylanica]SDX06306.1 Nucleotidyl transferase AbiEii toxin, Type IV TA system [Amycolatopsis xylanica]